MSTPLRILIVGAGIGGLTTASALARIGAHVDVIDDKPEISVAGVGFGLRINGLRAVREIGLLDDVLEIGHPAPGIDNYDADGTLLSTMSYGTRDEGLPGCVTMSRMAFLEMAARHALANGATFHMSTTVADIAQDADRATVTFNTGDSADYDLVLGFDGLNSQIRREYFGEKYAPRPVGGVAWRAGLPNRRKIMQPIIC